MLLIGFNNTYAKMFIEGYSTPVPSDETSYRGEIIRVASNYSRTFDSNGKVIKTTQKIVVYTKNSTGNNLQVGFTDEDIATGLSLMGAVGKNLVLFSNEGFQFSSFIWELNVV